jgi:hypothetical protein
VPALRRRRRPGVPAELDYVLAAQRLAVVARGHTRWLRLPDVQVIAAQRRSAAAPALGDPAAGEVEPHGDDVGGSSSPAAGR